ncbi:MAG TPA: polysaccharide biosynthesis/export family protein [Planctomycetota bacterium]
MRTFWVVAVCGLLAGCSSAPSSLPAGFKVPAPPPVAHTKADALALFEQAPDEDYRLGEGDVVTLHVWDRADLSGEHVVGPDGRVTVPFVGPQKLSGLSRDQAATAVRDALARFYANAVVTVRVQQYVSNQVVVLGRVAAPGVQNFPARPTLLEAIARAGGLARDTTQGSIPALTHCAIMRGRDKVAWIDLRRLLETGDLTLNLRLRPNDLVFIPEWEDVPVYVLGQVLRPGPIRWSPNISILDALAQAGGLGRDASTTQVVLARPSTGERFTFAQTDLLEARANAEVKKGDVLYVPTNLLADIGYVFEKINPFGWVFLATTVR